VDGSVTKEYYRYAFMVNSLSGYEKRVMG